MTFEFIVALCRQTFLVYNLSYHFLLGRIALVNLQPLYDFYL